MSTQVFAKRQTTLGRRKAEENVHIGDEFDNFFTRRQRIRRQRIGFDRARTFSYRPSNKNYPQPKDNTKGIFHQKRMGSFNGHTSYKLDNFESYTRKYFKKWYKDGDKVSIDPNSAT